MRNPISTSMRSFGPEVECKECGARMPSEFRHDCRPTRSEFRALEERLAKLERAQSAPVVPWPGDSEE